MSSYFYYNRIAAMRCDTKAVYYILSFGTHITFATHYNNSLGGKEMKEMISF